MADLPRSPQRHAAARSRLLAGGVSVTAFSAMIAAMGPLTSAEELPEEQSPSTNDEIDTGLVDPAPAPSTTFTIGTAASTTDAPATEPAVESALIPPGVGAVSTTVVVTTTSTTTTTAAPPVATPPPPSPAPATTQSVATLAPTTAVPATAPPTAAPTTAPATTAVPPTVAPTTTVPEEPPFTIPSG